MESGLLLSLCNPLLDISAVVPESFLEKYGVKAGNAILAEEKHLPVYDDLIKNFPVEYIAGGSAQNTVRVCQWMLQQKNVVSFVGCTGRDSFADKLRATAAAEGVNVQYMEDPSASTGTCAVLIAGKERSLIANLAAANNYKIEHLMTPEIQALVQKAQYYYISGFFLTVSPESIQSVAKHAAESNKVFMMNLSAPFIPEFFGSRLNEALPYVDFLFGNETEAAAYGRANGFETTDLKEIAQRIARSPKVNGHRERTVVITQGADAVIVATSSEVKLLPVPRVEPELIIDTNGAGDAFVGGFVSQQMQGKSIEDCVRAGNYAAGVVICHSGCTYPATPSFA